MFWILIILFSKKKEFGGAQKLLQNLKKKRKLSFSSVNLENLNNFDQISSIFGISPIFLQISRAILLFRD